ncbi:hypothetical protein INR49_013830 [Caranx melampygus]|nr:hypothetical protein INR49_013830 [Caranx melampygus]
MRYLVMLEEAREHEDSNGNIVELHNNGFYAAVMDEYLGRGLAILPLHLAASHRKVKSMQTLLSAGADPEMSCPSAPASHSLSLCHRDHHGRTTLHLVIIGWPRIPTWPKPDSKLQTAMIGVHRKAEACLRLLCEHGVNINAQRVRNTGNTPLHLAVVAVAMKTIKTLEDDLNCISDLLEHGAEPDAENKAGITPLHEACSTGNKELVDLLLRYGANINKLSRAGENCLFLFLNHKSNIRNCSLLAKLLSLTSPLTVYNKNGHLPSTLRLPCFLKQRDQLLNLTQQPRRLQDICKTYIYLQNVRDKKDRLKETLPKRLYDFVFNYWGNIHSISFVTGYEEDSINNVLDVSLS